MRWRHTLMLTAMMIAAPAVAAFEPQAVLYYKQPYGGQSKKANASSFGLQLNSRRYTDIVRKRPLLGMELRNNNVDNIRFRNLYLLGKRPGKTRRNTLSPAAAQTVPRPELGTEPLRQSLTVR